MTDQCDNPLEIFVVQVQSEGCNVDGVPYKQLLGFIGSPFQEQRQLLTLDLLVLHLTSR